MKLFKTKWCEAPSDIDSVMLTAFDDPTAFNKLDEMDVGQTVRDDDGELWERIQ